jgi:hypothetical protein
MIDLHQFCSKDAYRPQMQKPFNRGGYTWATNGAILVRAALDPQFFPLGESKLDVESAFKMFSPTDLRAPIASAVLPAPGLVKCTECGGDGRQNACPTCTCACFECSGTGREEAKVSIRVSGALFDLKYIAQIVGLPGIKFQNRMPDNQAPMSFTFDGGCGLLMPLRHSYYDATTDAKI